MFSYFLKRPMLLAAVFAVFICIVGYYSAVTVFVIGIISIALFFAFLRKPIRASAIVITFICIIVSVSLLITDRNIKATEDAAGTAFGGSFVVVEAPDSGENSYYCTVEAIECESLKKGTYMKLFYKENYLNMGDKFTAKITTGEIDEEYKELNYSEKTYLIAYMDELVDIDKDYDFVLSGVNKLRNYIADALFSNLKYREASTLVAIVFGDTSYMSDEFYSLTKSAGVTHILVVSGMHLATIILLITAIGEKIIYNPYIKALAMLLTVIFITFLCGFTKSIIRAGVCYIIYALSVALKMNNNSVNTLGTGICVILSAEPFAIFSVSFQLSLLSTLGIVAVAMPTINYIKRNKLFNSNIIIAFLSSIIITLSATLFTLPILVYIFGYVSTVSVLSNLLISYAVTMAICLAAVGLIVYAVIPPLGGFIIKMAGVFTEYIDFVIEELGSLGFATAELGGKAFIVAVLLVLAVIAIMLLVARYDNRLKRNAILNKIKREGEKTLKWN